MRGARCILVGSSCARRTLARNHPCFGSTIARFVFAEENRRNEVRQRACRLSSVATARKGSRLPHTLPSPSDLRSTQLLSTRYVSTWESLDNLSIWGGTGVILTTIHSMGLPYWSGFVVTNVIVRTTLVPFVLHSAHVAARFAKVAPEVQFLVSLFQNDLKKHQEQGASKQQQRQLLWTTMKTLRGIYKLHQINPLAVFISPILQIPFFWYASIDLRKIINGGDPELANQLTESGFLWVTDLTDPDPWYGLPILGGLLLYYNVEVAVGTKSLSGETASQSNIVRIMKDGFQSLAIFMPCFMSHSPAGMQIYLATSFLFTLGQGYALRSDACRALVGLPSMKAPKPEPQIANEFIKLKEQEQKAREERGDGDLLGVGVLNPGYEGSFAGTNRTSTIVVSGADGRTSKGIPEKFVPPALPSMILAKNMSLIGTGGIPFIHGVSAPPDQLESDQERFESAETLPSKEQEYLQEAPLDVMEAANQGLASPIRMAPEEKKETRKFSAKRFERKKRGKKSKKKR